jgi:hypothetical protein
VLLSVHMAKTRHSGRIFGRKWPENGQSVGQTTEIDPNRKLYMKLKTHPGWPEMPFFSHIGAPRGCQSVLILVCMLKLGTLGACLGEKRPKNDRSATEFGLARPNFNYM